MNNPYTSPNTAVPSSPTYPSAAVLSGSQYSQAQANQKCQSAWIYFKQELLRSDGAVIRTDDNTIVSEGQSYGMMLAVQNNDQNAFDNIWNWTKLRMQNGNPYGLFSWQTDINGNVLDTTPAPDAEEMIAMALFFASRRWGDKTSPYDYSVQAKTILQNILKYEMTSDYTLAFNPTNLDVFNPSYFMPAFYRLFSIYSGDKSWDTAAAKSYDLIFNCLKDAYGNTNNGLVPDFCRKDGSPHEWGQYFYYDAMRAPFHIGLDAIWFGSTEARAKIYTDKIFGFFGPQYNSFGNKYQLNGTKLENSHVTSWAGSFAGGVIGGSSDQYKVNFFNHLMSLPNPTGQFRYYDICWLNLGLLLSTGNFRIY